MHLHGNLGNMFYQHVPLQGQNYFARTVNPLLMGAIPKSCEIFIVAGPSLEFNAAELEMIAKHIAEGDAAAGPAGGAADRALTSPRRWLPPSKLLLL